MPKISQNYAQTALWFKGNLSWKFHDGQKKIEEAYAKTTKKLFVANCARRFGKSFWIVAKAIECAIRCRNKYPRIVIASATVKNLENFIIPSFRAILEDCPPELWAGWETGYLSSKRKFVFLNGSEIQLTGLDKDPDGGRGAYCDLYIIDEAGFVEKLDYLYSSVIAPMTLTRPKARIIVCSTPSSTPEHDFKSFCHRAFMQNSFIELDIYANPMMTPELIADAKAECLTESDWKREYLCFGGETPILTAQGFKEIQKVAVGDKVLTETGKWETVLRVFQNPLGDRETYELFNNRVTGNHKIQIAEGFRKTPGAVEFRSVAEIKPVLDTSRSNHRIYSVRPVNKGYRRDISKELAELTGWYLAEGNCHATNQAVYFSLGDKDPIDRVQELCVLCFGKPAADYGWVGKSKQLVLMSKAARDYFKQFGRRSWEKNLPGWMFFQTAEILSSLVDTYFLGDGHQVNNEWQASTVSRMLAVGIEELLISLGQTPRVHFRKSPKTRTIIGRKVNLRDAWLIRYNETEKRRDFNTGSLFYKQICKAPKKISNPDAFMYTLEVSNTHSYTLSGICAQNCQHVTDTNLQIVPEWDSKYEVDIPRPEYYPHLDRYEAMDLGVKVDLTALLFAYWDEREAYLYIEDEADINGPTMTTPDLNMLIRKKEGEIWKDMAPPYRRIADNNMPIILQDLGYLHGMHFSPTSKDELHAMVNELRHMVKEGKILVHPRCIKLITCLKAGIWNKERKAFSRSKNLGHYDHLAALVYLVRNLDKSRDNIPQVYKRNDAMFRLNEVKQQKATASNVLSMLGINRRK